MANGLPYQPTVPAQTGPPPGPPPRRSSGTAKLALVFAIAALVGASVGLGVSLSREGAAPPAPGAAAPADVGTLEVVSIPPDGAVTVDGRLVGLTPIDRLDLAAGRHAVVIDVFGYQPYVGTIEVEAAGAAALEAHLAPLGADGSSRGSFRGSGRAVDRAVPRSALVPAAVAAAAAAGDDGAPSGGNAPRKRARRSPPPPPKRDCSGERSTCKDACDDASFDCRARCSYCGSCTTDKTWEECNRICKTCQDGCEQNERFCESSCEGNYRSCSGS